MTTKKDQVAETITARIREGAYSGKIPGERALAAEFGMDFKTVNRAIGELVDQGLLVRKRGLGTFVAPLDRRPALTIGLCCHKYADPGRDPVFMRLFSGVNRAARAHGLRLEVTNLMEVTESGEDPASGAARFERACLANDPDGLIYLGNMDLAMIERLRAGRQLVVVGAVPEDSDLDRIRRDVTTGTAEAVRSLAAAGHSRIALATYTAGPKDFDLAAKETGYRAAMAALGLEPIVLTMDSPPASKLPQRLAGCDPRPTAVVCTESTLGLALTRAPAGIDLDWDELAIVGFDDGDIGALTRPPMSSIHAFGEELGELAVTRLVERLAGDRTERIDEVLPCPLIERVPNPS